MLRMLFSLLLISQPLYWTQANSEVETVWNHYKDVQTKDPVRLREHQNKAIDFNGLTMRYDYSRIGTKPTSGYPLYIALHGGGGAPPQLNDSQWNHMKIYYRDSVKNGIYLAPRGVTNTWNLHFVGESYVMYDRLIENMILFEDVDPNRIYVLGFSAGGDGVYQIATRMSDRFAAANMSAGHPNGVALRNLYRLPFLLQVGEMDGAYNRNRLDAEYCVALENLHQKDPDGFKAECNIHFQHPHNFLDNQPQGIPQKVIANPQKWLNEKDRTFVERDTNAVHWLEQFVRNPIPERVVWDLTTRANRAATPKHGQQSYWLDIGEHSSESLGTNEIIARIDRSQNAVVVEKSAPYLKILIRQEMLDLNQPILILVEGQTLKIQARSNSKTMSQTLSDRGDPNYIFEATLLLEKDRSSGQFAVSQLDG